MVASPPLLTGSWNQASSKQRNQIITNPPSDSSLQVVTTTTNETMPPLSKADMEVVRSGHLAKIAKAQDLIDRLKESGNDPDVQLQIDALEHEVQEAETLLADTMKGKALQVPSTPLRPTGTTESKDMPSLPTPNQLL